MAKSGHRPPLDSGPFTIDDPAPGDCVSADAQSTVYVKVEDQSSGVNTAFDALITPCGSAATGSHSPLFREGTTTFWWGRVPAGVLPTSSAGSDTPNKTLRVWPYSSGSQGNPAAVNFFAYYAGSGSYGSVSSNRCNNCDAGVPVPVMLQLCCHQAAIDNPSDSSGSQGCTSCDALNADFFLTHSDDGGLSCTWLSDTINFCGSDPGYWMLQKLNARQWDLTLVLAPAETTPFGIVRYTFSTVTDNDCTFPLELTFADLLTDPSCVNWPKSLTIVPAA
jgi:hypothetical protein